jgi:hypothetical protein
VLFWQASQRLIVHPLTILVVLEAAALLERTHKCRMRSQMKRTHSVKREKNLMRSQEKSLMRGQTICEDSVWED